MQEAIANGLGLIPKDGSETCHHNFDPLTMASSLWYPQRYNLNRNLEDIATTTNFAYTRPTPLPTHTGKKDTKMSTLNCKKKISSKLKSLACGEWRNQKNRLTPVKLESKKQAKKVVAER